MHAQYDRKAQCHGRIKEKKLEGLILTEALHFLVDRKCLGMSFWTEPLLLLVQEDQQSHQATNHEQVPVLPLDMSTWATVTAMFFPRH